MATLNILPKTTYKNLVGVVVNAGERMKTVRIRVPKQTWNSKIKKYYDSPYHLLVNDPTRACFVGDVIKVRSGWRVSKHVHHVVTEIVAPFGPPLHERPKLLTEAERVQQRAEQRKAKDERQAERGRAVSIMRLKEQKALEASEQRDEQWAAKMLAKSDKDVRRHTTKLVHNENDVHGLQYNVQKVIEVQLGEDFAWAAEEGTIETLTSMVVFRHAAMKQRHIGVTLPIKAGKQPDSTYIAMEEKFAETMLDQAKDAENLFKTTSEGQDHDTVLKALDRLNRRMKHSWMDTVLETKEKDARAARIEKFSSDLKRVKQPDTQGSEVKE